MNGPVKQENNREENFIKWYEVPSKEQAIAISGRLRLARNLRGFPFENRMSNDQKLALSAKIAETMKSEEFEALGLKNMGFEKMEAYSRGALVEQHLVSPEFAQNGRYSALFSTADNSLSVMANEEDHIRIQALLPGIELEKGLEAVNAADNIFDAKLAYAFDEKLGFLTECPTNLGTGLRASVMLHLPMLESSGVLPRISGNISKLGLTIRGTYGEGTKAKGSFYQISNQVTLGISEENAVKNLKAMVSQIIFQERALRDGIKGRSLEDKICRAYGILTNARLLSGDELMETLSLIRLGLDCRYISDISYVTLNRLAFTMGGANISAVAGRELSGDERDFMRAKAVRETLLNAGGN
ncbi:MAG: protein arginine kinase [Oscillospiraceae bacterium]|nr:protein arginine kinase [Oscillospiraceae bacterium]